MNEHRLAKFSERLRRRGVPVPVSSTMDFARALRFIDASDGRAIYWAGRTTLIKDPAHIRIYDEVFAAFSGDARAPAASSPRAGSGGDTGAGTHQALAPSADRRAANDDDVARSVRASAIDVLRHKRFDRVRGEEALILIRLIRNLRIETPQRLSRRRASSAAGDLPDLRATLRGAASAGGEPIEPAARGRRTTPRPVVLLLDISGSMRAYSRFLLQFAHAATRSGLPTHTFCFGTRITRVTQEIGALDPDEALARVADLVPDWEGGTKIGESLGTFLDRWGRKGLARGAIVVICSDGMERGEPDELAAQMARLARLSHKIVWINPLKGDARYEPTARGMAAALTYIDVFRSGHNLASLETLAAIMGRLDSTRADRLRATSP